MADAFAPLNVKNIEKRLKNHDSMCRMHVYSDGAARRCTCGRDAAIDELKELTREILDLRAKLQPTLPGMPK